MLDYTGQSIGKYHILRQLEQSAFAESYQATDEQDQSEVTITLLPPCPTGTEQQQFLERAQLLCRLHHPHIYSINGFGIQRERPFLITNLPLPPTLRQLYPQGTRLTNEEILRYSKECIEALRYAHSFQVLHGSLNPHTLRFDQEKQTLLVDFSLALMNDAPFMHHSRGRAETVSYTAPEQLGLQAVLASDQYALGIILYEWLAGELPFQGNAEEIVQQQLHASPPSLSRKVPGLLPYLEEAIIIALTKDPDERFKRIKAFGTAIETSLSYQPESLPTEGTYRFPHRPYWLEDLRNQAQGTQEHQFPKIQEPVAEEASVSAAPTATKKPLSRRIVLAGLLATGGIAIIGGIAISQRKEPVKTAAPTPTEDGNKTQVQNPLLSGEKSAGNIKETLKGHTEQVFAVSWSQDSRYLVSGSADTTAIVWNLQTGRALQQYQEHTDLVLTVAYSPDGKLIASGGRDKTIRIWDAATGKTQKSYTQHTGQTNALAWSKVTRLLASSSKDNSVQVWDPDSGTTKFNLSFSKVPRATAWSPDGKYLAIGVDDGKIHLHNASNGQFILSYTGHQGPIRALSWAPNSQSIVSASTDTTAHIWNVATGAKSIVYKGHQRPISALCWSFDGAHIASSALNQIHIWDAKSAKLLSTFDRHLLSVSTIQYAPDGRFIASAGVDQTVLIWQEQ